MSSLITALSTILSDISPTMVAHIFMAYCFLICSVSESCRWLPLIVCRYAPLTSSEMAWTSAGFKVLRSRTDCSQSGTFVIDDLLSSVFRSWSRICSMKAGTFAIELRFSSELCDSEFYGTAEADTGVFSTFSNSIGRISMDSNSVRLPKAWKSYLAYMDSITEYICSVRPSTRILF